MLVFHVGGGIWVVNKKALNRLHSASENVVGLWKERDTRDTYRDDYYGDNLSNSVV